MYADEPIRRRTWSTYVVGSHRHFVDLLALASRKTDSRQQTADRETDSNGTWTNTETCSQEKTISEFEAFYSAALTVEKRHGSFPHLQV
jgi:hypothetical protein